MLINGFMMTYHGWSAQLQMLSEGELSEKYTTLVLDNRGVGRSSRSELILHYFLMTYRNNCE